MKNLKISRSSKLIPLILFSVLPSLMAQDQTVSGDLEVNGKVDILTGPLSLGTAHFFDENNVPAVPAQGLTIHYSETPQNWSGSNYVKGKSSVRFQVAQESADFKWQFSEPDGFGEFGSVTLMQLSNEGLTVNGQKNTLPNQTLSEGNASILTLGLGDDRYLNKSGGTISGNLTITGSTLTVNGSQVLTTEDSANYFQQVDGSFAGAGSYAHPWSSAIAMGHHARAGESAVAIGAHAGMWEPATSGIKSVAIGYISRAPSDYSVAIGSEMWAAGNSVVAVGRMATTRSDNTIAIGHYAEANQVGQVVLGAFNERTNYSVTPSPTDTLFILGNGTSDTARSNALIVKRNGNMEVKGTSLTVNGAEVLTQASANTLYLSPTNAASTYLAAADAQTLYQPKLPTNVTYLTSIHLAAIETSIAGMIDPSELGTALDGYLTSSDKTELLGLIDDAIDEDELATALANFQVVGDYLSKDPQVGLAYGTGSAATAETSAVGKNAKANQAGAHAIGNNVVANRPGQVVVGNYNDYGTTETGSNVESPTDPIFVVGAGKAAESEQPAVRKNALTVKRNGDIEATGSVHVTGDINADGVIRVQPAGNLSMGIYQSVPPAP